MYLTHLSLTNFRNYTRLDVDIPRGPLLLIGGNAQGKTSLLEAVYFLATFVSFHASNDRQLINFLAAREPLAVARIVADLRYSGENRGAASHRLEVRIIQEDNRLNGAPRLRKEVLLDGVKRKVGEAIGEFNAVLFLPHMLRVVEGAPEERRRYLNLTMAQVIPPLAPALTEYGRTLSQRNALLKQLAERGGDSQQLSYWDEQLSGLGAQIIYFRIQALRDLERLARRVHAELTRAQEVLRLDYQPSFDPIPGRPMQYTLPMDTPVDRSGISLEKIQQGFQDCLERVRDEEIARGVTTIGPHRDELRFLGNGVDLGIYGSRGQARTAMLSLKLAEVAWMRERSGQWPVLLLDEVLAELDPQRREDLLQRLTESEQAMFTTTDLNLFTPDFVKKASLWHIHSGRLQEVDHGSTG
jgi:DNA replication and repair protein RecF